MSESSAPLQIKRAAWHTRVQVVVFAWFALAAAVALVRFDDWQWFLVHFLMLGAVSNALFIWSWHFTGAILRVPDQADRSAEVQRLLGLNLGVAGTVIGVRAEAPAVIIGSVALVVVAVALHGRTLWKASQRALPSPYAFTVQVYIAACSLLVSGLVLGALLESLSDDDSLRAQLVLAHVAFNVLGWVGLPILGTIVTLWPTMLRTRIAPNAALLGRKALPLLVLGVLITASGYAIGVTAMAAIGLGCYGFGFVRTLQPMFAVMRNKRPAAFSTWTALAGMAWLLMAVVLLLVSAIVIRDIDTLGEHTVAAAFIAMVGVIQVLIGCMAYLVPAMAAGGPAIVRLRNDIADRGMVLRVVLVNFGAGIALLSVTQMVGATLLLAGLLWSLVQIALTVRTPRPDRVVAADAARVWVDDKEVRPFPFARH